MDEGEPSDARRAGVGIPVERGRIAAFRSRDDGPARPGRDAVVSFDRRELREIFNLYGRRVAEGEWRDYAIDFTAARAVFSIYRRASEVPLYRVEKDPALARRQGAYAVVAGTGLVLKRGDDLGRVLQVLEKKPRLTLV